MHHKTHWHSFPSFPYRLPAIAPFPLNTVNLVNFLRTTKCVCRPHTIFCTTETHNRPGLLCWWPPHYALHLTRRPSPTLTCHHQTLHFTTKSDNSKDGCKPLRSTVSYSSWADRRAPIFHCIIAT
jgi:hypothetical protein